MNLHPHDKDQALNVAPSVQEEFAREILTRSLPVYDALPHAREPVHLAERALFLERALFVVAHFRCADLVAPFFARAQELLGAPPTPRPGVWLDTLLRQCIRTLGRGQMYDELDQFLCAMAEQVLQGRSVQDLDCTSPGAQAQLRMLLRLAEGWYAFGWDTLAEPVTQRTWDLLASDTVPSREQTELACAYAGAVGQAPPKLAQHGLEAIFRELRGVGDTYTTAPYFSVTQLDVIEAVVLAAVEPLTQP